MMKTIFCSHLAALAAFLLAGCGKSDAQPAAVAVPAPRVIAITAGDDMKFSVTAIEAKPGEKLRITLANIGVVPKAAMAHNWVLLKAGTDPAAFAVAAIPAKDTGYIPESLKDEVIARIDLIGSGERGEIELDAPAVPGDYPYLCTFPAHFQVGMRGTLTVK